MIGYLARNCTDQGRIYPAAGPDRKLVALPGTYTRAPPVSTARPAANGGVVAGATKMILASIPETETLLLKLTCPCANPETLNLRRNSYE